MQVPTFVYLLTQMTCWHVLSLWIFSISLFTYYNRCQQKQVQAPTCICLFMQNCLLTCAFGLNINISLFTYYNRCQHKQVDATTRICLCMQICLLKCAFGLNINISLFTYDNLCQHKQLISFSFRHLFQNWRRNRYQRDQIFPLLFTTHLTELFQNTLLHQFILKPQVLQVSINHIIHSVFHNGISYPLTNTRLLSALKSWTVFTEA